MIALSIANANKYRLVIAILNEKEQIKEKNKKLKKMKR